MRKLGSERCHVEALGRELKYFLFCGRQAKAWRDESWNLSDHHRDGKAGAKYVAHAGCGRESVGHDM